MDILSIDKQIIDNHNLLMEIYNSAFFSDNILNALKQSAFLLRYHINVEIIRVQVNFKEECIQKIYELYNSGINENEIDYNDIFIFSNKTKGVYLSFKAFKGLRTNQFSFQEINLLENYAKIISTFLIKDEFEKMFYKSKVTDSLTGIGNRNALIKYIAGINENKVADQYAGLFVNIRSMKMYNQKYSQAFGDLLLVQFANQAAAYIGDNGIIIRIGGDNFVIIILKDNLEDLLEKLSNFSVDLSGNCISPIKSIDLKFYTGVYRIQTKFISFDSFMMNITLASFACRNNEISPYIEYSYELSEKIVKTKETEELLANSLKSQKFFINLQPKVSLTDYRLTGAEALVRWNYNGKVIFPNDFISIAERSGIICEIDFWVYETVCSLLRKWINQGINPIPISCNFSRLHLNSPNFLNKLVDVAQKYHVPTEYIEIELTEMIYINNLVSVSEFINGLKAKGFRTSIDDFGSGYSSLNLLKNIRTDVIKLDKEFLNINNNSNEDKIIIESIVNMSKNLDMYVVSEGVETEEQVEFLKSINCDTAQGFYFSKPVSVQEFEQMLENKNSILK